MMPCKRPDVGVVGALWTACDDDDDVPECSIGEVVDCCIANISVVWDW